MFIVARVIFRRPPRFPWLARKGRARQDAAHGLAEGVAEDVSQGLVQESAFGGRAARALLASPPTPPPQSLCSSR